MVKNNDIGQIGYVKLDADLEKLGPTRCFIVTNKRSKLERGAYVRIKKNNDQFYVGQVIDGPYFLGQGEKTYETNYIVDLSASIKGDVQAAVLDRPEPNTPVYLLEETLIQKFLGTTGDLNIGNLVTQGFVRVKMDPRSMTRHLGIFGTTGGGKSNTIQTIKKTKRKTN